MAITTRQTTATGVVNKDAPLSNAELDQNFVELQQNKVNVSDIVGTVATVGGPVIIERGSNANGEYVKFADGTLIMTITTSHDMTGMAVNVILPATILYSATDKAVVSVGLQDSSNIDLGPMGDEPLKDLSFIAAQLSNNTMLNVKGPNSQWHFNPIPITLTVIGRWG